MAKAKERMMMNERQRQFLDSANARFAPVVEMLQWSENYDSGESPVVYFLDLIGWSDEVYGEPLTDMRNVSEQLGYLELSHLGQSLVCYADNHTDVYEFVSKFFELEEEDTETTS